MNAQHFETRRDPERRPGTWVTCSQVHEGETYALRAFVLDNDPTLLVAATVKTTERLSRAVARTIEHHVLGYDDRAYISHWDGIALWKDREGAPPDAVRVRLPEVGALKAWDATVKTWPGCKAVRIDDRSFAHLRADLLQGRGQGHGRPRALSEAAVMSDDVSLAGSLRKLDHAAGFGARLVIQPRAIVISDECWRETAEAEHPGMQVIGPRDMKQGAACLADVFAEEPQVAEVRREHGLPLGDL